MQWFLGSYIYKQRMVAVGSEHAEALLMSVYNSYTFATAQILPSRSLLEFS